MKGNIGQQIAQYITGLSCCHEGTLKVISNTLLDIDFMHGNIHGLLYENIINITILPPMIRPSRDTYKWKSYLSNHLIIIGSIKINSLWPGDRIWHCWFWSTLVQVVACCLMAPSYYLKKYWLIIDRYLLNSPDNNFAGNTQDINS